MFFLALIPILWVISGIAGFILAVREDGKITVKDAVALFPLSFLLGPIILAIVLREGEIGKKVLWQKKDRYADRIHEMKRK